MPDTLPHLIPPFRYAIVEERLFRGGYPKPRNLRFLKRLRLKTILSLIPDPLLPEVQEFCAQQNITLLHFKVDKMREDNIPLSYSKTLMALQVIIDPANHPLYIHCLDGADVTGLVIACLRKLQMWSTSSAMSEFSRYLHTSVISAEEFEFVENFKNFEITIPATIPVWLWGGQVSFRKHSCLRLKFLNPEMMTEEERELKERKEKMEREKEEMYKKRKNDLLDNFLEPVNASARHRTSTQSSSTVNDSASDSTAQPSESQQRKTSSRAGSDHARSAEANEDIREEERIEEQKSTKDQYFVEVDVDVDGVMMDGLDQLEYQSRLGQDEFGRQRSYYRDQKRDSQGLGEDEEEEMEPISRTLEALALEGLGD